MKIGTVFEISYGHRVMNHPGKCKNYHGHNGKVELQIEGIVQPDTGMVLDFGLLKDGVRDWVNRHFDHSTILQEGDPLIESMEGRLVVLSHPPTAEILSEIILHSGVTQFLKHLDPGISGASVRFWETRDCYAECRTGDPPLGFKLHWATK